MLPSNEKVSPDPDLLHGLPNADVNGTGRERSGPIEANHVGRPSMDLVWLKNTRPRRQHHTRHQQRLRFEHANDTDPIANDG